MKQQTVVEWLENEYNTKGKLTVVDFYQAKAMFQEQIENTYDDGIMKGRQEDGQEYYNETFNKNIR
jgi:hypothetical protein